VLMEKFYALWRPEPGKQGMTPAQALRAAQAHVRAQPGWSHPHYWAAWVLWGLAD
jgi:CHAT domain-containing protein